MGVTALRPLRSRPAFAGGRGLVLMIAITMAFFSHSYAHAQDIGVVAPRSLVQRAFNAVSCAPHVFTVPDRGLNVHMVIYTASAGVTGISVDIAGSFDNVTYVPIVPGNSTTVPIGSNFAKIYMPFIRVRILSCTGAGTITAYYSGSWGFDPFFLGNSPIPPGDAFACPLRANVTIAAAGDTAIITPSSATASVVLCSLNFSATATGAFQIISGTGATCGTGTVTTYGSAFPNLLALAMNLSPGTLSIKFPAGHKVCLRVTGTTTAEGLALYAEQ